MKVKIFILMLIIAALFIVVKRSSAPLFEVKPYLQIGKNPSPETLDLLWHTSDADANWTVEYHTKNTPSWKKTRPPKIRRVNAPGIDPHRIYQITFTGLEPGSNFNYRVVKDKKIVFTAEAHALKSPDQPYRFLAFGDCGAGTDEQKPLAERAFLSKPDMIVIPGDIVYEHGLISEYREKFWPVYNAENVDASGAPMLRSIPFVSIPGNHDTEMSNLDVYPDGLAYFLLWDQPLNGPPGKEGGSLAPFLIGSEQNKKPFLEAAGDAYPGMANYSFNYGNAHWIMLDSNPYVNWTDPALVDWVAKDLADAKDATWKFVTFHHPGFSSSRAHFDQEHMRSLSPVFEAGNVDIVFNGHVHNYQRSFPLKFTPDKNETQPMDTGDKTNHGGTVNGQWLLDKTFDGKSDTTPEGIIYIVTGAGGHDLHNPEQQNDPGSWQKFTCKFISTVHSLTVADVEGKTLTLRQVTADGAELDHLVVTKE